MARYSYRKDEMMIFFSASNSATQKNSGVTRCLISSVINAHRASVMLARNGIREGIKSSRNSEHMSLFILPELAELEDDIATADDHAAYIEIIYNLRR